MAVTSGGYDPSKLGSGGVYGTKATPPKPKPTYQGATDSSGLGFRDYFQGTTNDDIANRNWAVVAPNKLTPTGGLPLPQPPRNQNPYGGVPGGGGGGGSGDPAPNWDAIYGLLGAAKPQQYQYQDLDLPEYDAPDFYEWDPSQFNTARQAVTDQIGAGRTSGNQTYADAFTELNQYQNPYGTTRTTNPGVRDAMARMMQANGFDPDLNAQVDWEGQQADDAFGYTQALLAGTADQRQDSNLRALGGDQRRFNEGLDSEQRMLGTSIDLAMARAKGQYDKDLFQYGKEEADRRYEMNVAEITANNQGQNQANQMNTQAMNAWQGDALAPILELLMEGKTGVDVNKILAAIGRT